MKHVSLIIPVINTADQHTSLDQRSVILYSNGQIAHHCCPVATVKHVVHTRLLLVSTAVMSRLISVDCCYH
jgi:hypothetical protein